jgi:AraC-like DNA-binding protein
VIGAADDASFVSAPVGHWRVAGCSLVFAHSPTLCGSICWGRQTADETRAVMRLFDGYSRLAPRFDLILDGSLMDRVEISSMMVFVEWARHNLDDLHRRVRHQAGISAPGLGAYLLAGIVPLLGGPWPFTLVTHRRQAFRLLLPDGGDALCDEVDALVEQARGVPPLVGRLREILAARHGRLSIGDAARALGRSVRSFQRELREAGFSYRQEQHEAYYRRAEQLLAGDDKIARVAARLGLSERAMTALVRARSGLTPGELRNRLRGS